MSEIRQAIFRRRRGEPGLIATTRGPIHRRIHAQVAAAIILIATAAATVRILFGTSQFIINDFMPFSTRMLDTCLLPYEGAGLGRENHNAIPSFCDFGALSLAFGGALAQHLALAGAFALAGISMFLFLRRIGNPWQLCLFGALLYEFSPSMLNFQESGWAYLLTSALLPAILLGAIPSGRSRPWVDGTRSGALFALLSYANPQAPVLVALLLVPLLGASFLSGHQRRSLTFAGCMAVVFLVAAIPVFQILPGYAAQIQNSRQVILEDLALRLSRDTLADFFAPYLFIGAIPGLIGLLLIGFHRDVHASEWAAVVSSASIISIWETLRRIGPDLAQVMPQVALFKDFIKLQIVLAVPITVLSMMALRWLLGEKAPRWGLSSRILLAGARILLLFAALSLAMPIVQKERTALASGQLGLPENAQVPSAYQQVLRSIHLRDPNLDAYRILWLPIDWRFFLSSRSIEPSALLYYQDSPAAAQRAVLDSFNAIVSGSRDLIAPLLSQAGVKYVVVDIADGQVPGEPWQQGQMNVADVWGTRVLAGSTTDYAAVFKDSPGLNLVTITPSVLVFRNEAWQPILRSYAGSLGVDARTVELLDLLGHSELRLPIWRELPDLLLIPGMKPGDGLAKSGHSFWLSESDPSNSRDKDRIVRLIADRDVSLTGQWGVSGAGNHVGLKNFVELQPGHITIRPSVIADYPTGSQVVWLEYRSGEDDPTRAAVHRLTIDSPTGPTIACATPHCTVANILIVPPIGSPGVVARFAEAYSPLLTTPDGHPPLAPVAGEWATIYSPGPRGVPSSAYNSSAIPRWIGLALGHLVAAFGLLVGIVVSRPAEDR